MGARNQARIEIEAARNIIFDLLLEEAGEGVERGAATVIASERGARLEVDVAFGWAMTVRQSYALERRSRGVTLVTASIQPRGFRWHLTNLLLLGRGMTALRNASEVGLDNLKRSAERAPDAESEGAEKAT